MSERLPKYRHHKPSGQAVVTLNGHDHYLGKWNTAESRREYDRLIAEWLANGRCLPGPGRSAGDLSVNEVMAPYVEFIATYYRRPDGSPTSEVDNIKLALRPLKRLYGHTAAADFDGPALEAVRLQMIRDGLCRNRINKDVARIKRLFRWAAAKKLVPGSVYQELQAVEGLRAGRSEAKETAPVKPVPEAVVEAMLPHLRPPAAAMVRLQRLTGMRPGEVTVMRGIDLDMTGPVWLYRPGSDQGPHGAHKTAWRGHARVVPIGPRGQEIVRQFLKTNLYAYLFSPRDAMDDFRAEQRRNRKSKVPPSQRDRRKRKPRKAPGARYTVAGYANTVVRAIRKANTAAACERCKELEPEQRCDACKAAALPHWHPNQLRHLQATKIRRAFGIDAARAVLGHRSPAVTEVYAELDMGKAAEVMERLG
jgi:integrase